MNTFPIVLGVPLPQHIAWKGDPAGGIRVSGGRQERSAYVVRSSGRVLLNPIHEGLEV